MEESDRKVHGAARMCQDRFGVQAFRKFLFANGQIILVVVLKGYG